MMQSPQLVVLSSENHFAWLKAILLQMNLSLEIYHCDSAEAIRATGLAPLVIVLLEPTEQDFTYWRAEFPLTAFILIQEHYNEKLAQAYIEATSGHYLLKNQVNLIEAMLRHILIWQEHVSNRDNRIQAQQTALFTLATSSLLNSGDWDAALREVCSLTARMLQVNRVSVWLFDNTRTKIQTQMLYKLDEDSFESGAELAASSFPNYFTALMQNRVVVSPNARTAPETSDFTAAYFEPLNIYSILDAPIRVNGICIGIFCFEQQHKLRNWTVDEQVFAAEAADLVALWMETLENRRIQQAMMQTEKLQSLGLLASGIAHDFNNLLTVILSQSSLIADLLQTEHPAQHSLQHIINTTRQASALTRQLLTYAGNKPVQLAALSLKEFMEEHRNFLRLAIASHIELQIDDAGDLGIEADITQLQQIMMNLVINAAEAMGDTSGKLHISFTAETLPENFARANCYKSESFKTGDYVRLTVTDTGAGIPEATLKRIFEPFFSTKANGRGVGLATIMGAVRAHGGAICVDSSPGRGTSFHLYFRRASVDVIEKTKTGAITAVQARTVLVVDDTPEIVESISEILEINGLNTLAAYNGADALNIYRNDAETIDLVLVDMSMPGMNGAETFEQIKKIKTDARIIMLSGYNDKEVLRQFPNERPTALLAKPYDVNTLLETIWKHLA